MNKNSFGRIWGERIVAVCAVLITALALQTVARASQRAIPIGTQLRIRLEDGVRYPIAAEIVRLYDAESGEYVDAEGAIETSGRGHQTLKRTGIGALAGGLFGAFFGGKGAAVGSIVGGATGAGSAAAQGSKELVVEEGTELLIRTIPRSVE